MTFIHTILTLFMLLRTGTFPIEEHNFSLLSKDNLINKPTFKTIFFFFLQNLEIYINHLILKLNVRQKSISNNFSRYFQVPQRLLRKSLVNPPKYLMFCTIWYYLYNLKSVKNTHGGVLL